MSAGAPGVRVGIIDSGWDRTVKDARVANGVGLVDPDDDCKLGVSNNDHDVIGHGTFCGDLVLQVAPDATIVPIRVFGRRLETSPEILVSAIHWAMENRLRVVNLSLGTSRSDARNRLYHACELARRQGMIIVAAAMEGDPSGGFPAAFEPVIGVRAARVSNRYQIKYFAGQAHECGAQAIRQRGRGLGGVQREANGTSAAAPIVTGYVARLLEKEPGLDLDAVRDRLRAHSSASATTDP